MAPKTEKVRDENAQVAEFLRHLYMAGSFKSWAGFGRQAGGIPGPTMSDWKRGENAPSGYNLLRLIWAAERKNEHSLAFASLMTDPLVGAGIRIAADMAQSIPGPDVSRVRAEASNGQADSSGAAVVPLAQDLRDRLGALEVAVAEVPTKQEFQEGLDTLRAAIDRVASRGTGEDPLPEAAEGP